LHTVSHATALLGGAHDLVDGGACGASMEGLYLMTALAGDLLATTLNVAQGKKR
jgi:hypothetical protein